MYAVKVRIWRKHQEQQELAADPHTSYLESSFVGRLPMAQRSRQAFERKNALGSGYKNEGVADEHEDSQPEIIQASDACTTKLEIIMHRRARYRHRFVVRGRTGRPWRLAMSLSTSHSHALRERCEPCDDRDPGLDPPSDISQKEPVERSAERQSRQGKRKRKKRDKKNGSS